MTLNIHKLGLGALGGLLLFVVLVDLPARLVLLPGNATRESLLAGKLVSESQMDSFVATRLRALAWRSSGEVLNDLALVSFERAARENFKSPDSSIFLRQSIAWQERALGQAPANTYGWARLAYARLLVDGANEGAARALSHALETDPHEPPLLLLEISMAVRLWDVLDAETKSRIPELMRAAFALNPKGLTALAARENFTEMVQDSLAVIR